jgi:hypothetical protein
MTVYDIRSDLEPLDAPPLWVCALRNRDRGPFRSSQRRGVRNHHQCQVQGLTVIAAGAFEIVHAFGSKGWGKFLWQILLRALYAAFGVVLLTQPALVCLDPHLSPQRCAARLSRHSKGAELRPLAAERMDDAYFWHLWVARRRADPIWLCDHQRLGRRILLAVDLISRGVRGCLTPFRRRDEPLNKGEER